MRELIYKSEILKRKEFSVLLAMSGIEKMKLTATDSDKEMDPEALNLTLFGLYQKGILIWKEQNKYEIKPEIRQLLKQIRDARREIELDTPESSLPMQCFQGESIVICEWEENGEDTVKLHMVSEEEFFQEMIDRKILPEFMKSYDFDTLYQILTTDEAYPMEGERVE